MHLEFALCGDGIVYAVQELRTGADGTLRLYRVQGRPGPTPNHPEIGRGSLQCLGLLRAQEAVVDVHRDLWPEARRVYSTCRASIFCSSTLPTTTFVWSVVTDVVTDARPRIRRKRR
jgi:hypothetical protein